MTNKEIIQKIFANTDNYYLLRSDLISQIEDCMNLAKKEVEAKQCDIHDVVVPKGTLCYKCYDTDGFYLGTTCPKCKQPFRSVKA